MRVGWNVCRGSIHAFPITPFQRNDIWNWTIYLLFITNNYYLFWYVYTLLTHLRATGYTPFCLMQSGIMSSKPLAQHVALVNVPYKNCNVVLNTDFFQHYPFLCTLWFTRLQCLQWLHVNESKRYSPKTASVIHLFIWIQHLLRCTIDHKFFTCSLCQVLPFSTLTRVHACQQISTAHQQIICLDSQRFNRLVSLGNRRLWRNHWARQIYISVASLQTPLMKIYLNCVTGKCFPHLVYFDRLIYFKKVLW